MKFFLIILSYIVFKIAGCKYGGKLTKWFFLWVGLTRYVYFLLGGDEVSRVPYQCLFSSVADGESVWRVRHVRWRSFKGPYFVSQIGRHFLFLVEVVFANDFLYSKTGVSVMMNMKIEKI